MLSQVLCDKEREEKNMSTFIATMIMKQADNNLEKGQSKYKAYFVNTTLYLKWKDEVDTILEVEGYEDCIVE